MLLIIAIVGTTVAPRQLFFQQSNVIDKRITPRFIGYERADTTLGAFVVVGGTAAVTIVAVYAVRGTGLASQFTDALGVAHALGKHDYVLGALFAIVLLDASIIAASPVTLATSYARTGAYVRYMCDLSRDEQGALAALLGDLQAAEARMATTFPGCSARRRQTIRPCWPASMT